jgi:carboxymethylenebutenolidase
MGEFVKLTANDGNELSAYVARPEGTPTGAVVVVQEIFGVNAHIRSVADGYAKEGYVAIAPALFDRSEKGIELEYNEAGWKKAFELYGKLNVDTALLDVAAAYKFVEAEDHRGIAVVGFCYGGLMAWLTATRGEVLKIQPSCTVGYYAGGVGNVASEEPSCPVMLHFGAEDTHIGKDQIDAVREAHPEVEVFVYEGAGHAFNRDADPKSYNVDAAKLARERTLEFLRTHIA